MKTYLMTQIRKANPTNQTQLIIVSISLSCIVLGSTNVNAGYIQLPGSWGGSSEATIEAWVNTDVVTHTLQAIVSSTVHGFVHFQLAEPMSGSNPTVQFYTDTGLVQFPSPPTSPTGVWRHIVVVAESGNSQLVIDGVPVATNSKIFTQIGSGSDILIARGWRSGRQFLGLLDEVAIYDTALRNDRIQAHFNAASALDDSYLTEVLADNPVGYWPLNDAPGSSIDASGNGRNGTPSGAIVYQRPGALANGDFAMRFADIVTLNGLTFTVANPPGHFHFCFGDCPAGGVAEVGNVLGERSEDIRGLSEFDLTGLSPSPFAKVVLSFDALFAGGLILENENRPFDGDINIVSYQGNNERDVSDWDAPSTGAVATFNTTGLNVGDTLSFDITSAFNAALAGGFSSLGVRMEAVSPPFDTAWTFHNFSVRAVPSPSAAWLCASGIVGLLARRKGAFAR